MSDPSRTAPTSSYKIFSKEVNPRKLKKRTSSFMTQYLDEELVVRTQDKFHYKKKESKKGTFFESFVGKEALTLIVERNYSDEALTDHSQVGLVLYT